MDVHLKDKKIAKLKNLTEYFITIKEKSKCKLLFLFESAHGDTMMCCDKKFNIDSWEICSDICTVVLSRSFMIVLRISSKS